MTHWSGTPVAVPVPTTTTHGWSGTASPYCSDTSSDLRLHSMFPPGWPFSGEGGEKPCNSFDYLPVSVVDWPTGFLLVEVAAELDHHGSDLAGSAEVLHGD